jgi:beta-N-acetylhexosaminidase
MTAHILYPQIEKETYVSRKDQREITLPATLSKTIVTDLLRKELGFDGVVITDAMNMDAVAAHFDPLDAARLALNAGVDMILMPVDLSAEAGLAAMDDYISGMADMIEKGEIPGERIDEALLRILTLKGRYGLLDTEVLPSPVPSIGTKEHHDIEWNLALKGITLLKNQDRTLPLEGAEKVLITLAFASQENSAQYAVRKAREEGLISPDAEILIRTYGNKAPEEAAGLPEDLDAVIAVSAVYSPANLDPGSESGKRTACLKAILKAAGEEDLKTVLISAQLPYDAAAFPEADAIVCCYNGRGMTELPDFTGPVKEYGPNLPAALYTLFGGMGPAGKLPVNIPVLEEDHTFGEDILYERGWGLSYE